MSLGCCGFAFGSVLNCPQLNLLLFFLLSFPSTVKSTPIMLILSKPHLSLLLMSYLFVDGRDQVLLTKRVHIIFSKCRIRSKRP